MACDKEGYGTKGELKIVNPSPLFPQSNNENNK
jgi:hypothetical protein